MLAKGSSKRACDRCHKVKEKCRWIDARETCERCLRLGSMCHTYRPLATAGRKPRQQAAKVLAISKKGPKCVKRDKSTPNGDFNIHAITSQKKEKISRALRVFVDLNPAELQLLYAIIQGRTRVEQFIVGPSFLECHRIVFHKYIGMAAPLLKDALIASSALIACDHDTLHASQNLQIGHRRAASAVSALRSLRIEHAGDLPTILIYAIAMVTFAIHITGTAFPICRRSLLLIKPFYEPTVELDSDGQAFLICLIHDETAECLLRCEIPTLRFRAEKLKCVDRFLGVAPSLLPYLYDICQISYGLNYCIEPDPVRIMERLANIEVAVEAWIPILPIDLTQFLHTEVISLLAQARVFRWAILLISHRLRHPYGTESSKGATLSDSILDELDMAIRVAKRSMPCVEISFIAACFEITNSGKRKAALEKIDVVIECSRQFRVRIKTLIESFWAVRDNHDELYWFNIGSYLAT